MATIEKGLEAEAMGIATAKNPKVTPQAVIVGHGLLREPLGNRGLRSR